jgi:hypothetical protein
VTVHVGVGTLVPSPLSGPEDLLGRVEDFRQAAFRGVIAWWATGTQDTFGLVR